MGSKAPSALASAISGSLASSTSLAITYPLLTLTTRQQVLEQQVDMNNNNNAKLFASLYSGLQPAVATTFISQGIYFYFQRLLMSVSRGMGFKNSTALQSLLVAAVAGAVNVCLTEPLWIIVTRLQAQQPSTKSRGFVQVMQELIGESEGALAFWKGIAPSLVLVLNPAIVFMVYEPIMARARRRVTRNPKALPLTSRQIFVIGAIAKLIATIITYPMLTVKSRMQASRSQKLPSTPTPTPTPPTPTPTPPPATSLPTQPNITNTNSITNTSNYSSVLSTVRTVANEHGGGLRGGAKGLYSGMQAKILQTVLNTALMFVLKDCVDPVARIIARDDN